MVDITDLKSVGLCRPCRFKSGRRYHLSKKYCNFCQIFARFPQIFARFPQIFDVIIFNNSQIFLIKNLGYYFVNYPGNYFFDFS